MCSPVWIIFFSMSLGLRFPFDSSQIKISNELSSFFKIIILSAELSNCPFEKHSSILSPCKIIESLGTSFNLQLFSIIIFLTDNKGFKMNKGTLYGVSIGPGDPELITVKAMNIISKCKYIATPHTGTGDSLALSIVSQATDLSQKEILLLEFPMTKDKDILAESHKNAAESIAKVLDEGEDVAMLNLGDVTIFSTFAYTMDQLLEKDYDVEVIPGVTSFCASASKLRIGLTTMNDPLHIIPATGIDLKEALQMPGSKVLMKIGRSMPKLIETLKELNLEDNVYAVENCGLENEKIYNSLDEFDENMGYFTIVVVK